MEIRAITGKLPKTLHSKGSSLHPPEDWIGLLERRMYLIDATHSNAQAQNAVFVLHMVMLSVMAAKITSKYHP